MPKLFPLALAALLLCPRAFADSFDVTALNPASNPNGDLSASIAGAEAVFQSARGAALYTQDVALISQTGDANFAVIDQESVGSGGNFAAIGQSAATPSVAYIHQSGSGNLAVIYHR
jgi:hypothetical protein